MGSGGNFSQNCGLYQQEADAQKNDILTIAPLSGITLLVWHCSGYPACVGGESLFWAQKKSTATPIVTTN